MMLAAKKADDDRQKQQMKIKAAEDAKRRQLLQQKLADEENKKAMLLKQKRAEVERIDSVESIPARDSNIGLMKSGGMSNSSPDIKIFGKAESGGASEMVNPASAPTFAEY